MAKQCNVLACVVYEAFDSVRQVKSSANSGEENIYSTRRGEGEKEGDGEGGRAN